ncbi:MAG: cytochrome c biogenesis protein CcsA [Planctomycetaceae bacterium]|nr:cytochrome c biogenesis protein CcsA [Planctomycetaceae bacterium]
MGFLAQVHIYCFLMSYLVSLGCEVLQVLRRPFPLLRALLLIFTIAGFVAHTAFLFTRGRSEGLPPLLTSQQDWLLVLAWLGSLLYLILLLTYRQMAHGIFMLPAILLLVIVALFASPVASGNLHEQVMRRWGMFHAASLVLGIGAVAGAALSGLMYLLHYQRLKTRNAWLMKLALPNLENLSAVNRWMVVFSVPCLTIGLLTGFLLISFSKAQNSTYAIPWTDPTIVTTILVWLAMIVVLIRILMNTQQTGRAVAQLSFLSGGFLLLTVLGPMLLAGQGSFNAIHGRPQTSTGAEAVEGARAESGSDVKTQEPGR